MRALILACLFSFFADSAFASGQNATVFPPSDCVAGTESVLSTYYGGGSDFSSTKCKTGQDVMKLAIPNCGEDQQVVFQSGAFTCENKPALPASCGTGEVLTYNANGFVCVKVGESVPTCAADQFLTYNGTTFQCASTKQVSIPTCTSDQVVKADGNQLYCDTLPSQSGKMMLVYKHGQESGYNGFSLATAPTCPSGWHLMNWVPIVSYDYWTTIGLCSQ
jgi:hypothetical protein